MLKQAAGTPRSPDKSHGSSPSPAELSDENAAPGRQLDDSFRETLSPTHPAEPPRIPECGLHLGRICDAALNNQHGATTRSSGPGCPLQLSPHRLFLLGAKEVQPPANSMTLHTVSKVGPRHHQRPSSTPSPFPCSLESQPPVCNPQSCQRGVTVPISQMGEDTLGSEGRQMVNGGAELAGPRHLRPVYAKAVWTQIQTHSAPQPTRHGDVRGGDEGTSSGEGGVGNVIIPHPGDRSPRPRSSCEVTARWPCDRLASW